MSFVPPPPQSLFAGHAYGSYAPPRDVPTGPPVTVFVGNITERAQDAMIRHLLTTCGPVLSWKRVQGATGKPQAFGFCEYGNPDAGLRSIRILHDWLIGDKALVVKVDAKTSELLDEYKVQRARRVFGKDSISLDKPEEYMDEGMYAEDALAKERISAILHDHAKEMNAFVPKSSGDKSDENRPKIINQTGPKESLADVEMEDGKRDIIHREIDKFRETMKIREAEKEEEKKKREEESSKSSSQNGSSRRHSPPDRRRRDRSSGRRSARPSVTRSRSRSYSPRRRESRSSRRSRRASRSRSRSRSRRRDRSTPPRKSQVELWKEREMEEEAKERKKAERKAREKEANYQERLRKWENRESKMAKEFEKEKMREVKRLEEMDREAKRLKEFLEDYDDERDDEKYYRGRELDRRLLEREREAAKDGEDRSREKEEIEDLKNQIVEEGYKGHDQSMELQRRMEERERRHNGGPPPPGPGVVSYVPPIVHIDDEPVIIPAPPDQQAVDNIAVEGGMSPDPSSPPVYKLDDNNSAPPPQHDIHSPPVAIPHNIVPAIHIPVQSSQTFTPVPLSKPSLMPEVIAPSEPGAKKKLDVRDVFNQDDDDVASGQKKGRKSLPPISKQEDPSSGGGGRTSSEDKRKHIKSLIEKIPTDRSALFAYNVDWDMVDNQLMEKRIRPWVNKKIAEYIGEPEPTLTDFICSKVLAGSTPKAVLEDVQMVLDEEAEVFVVKMWRLLIYEIENKKYKASTGTTTTTTTTTANTGSSTASSGGGVER